MKKIIAFALLALPLGAAADHLDVIDFKLKEGCLFIPKGTFTFKSERPI